MHCYRALREILFFCLFISLSLSLSLGIAGAVEPIPEGILEIDGKIAEDGTTIEISWAKAAGSGVDRVSIQRRILGETFKASWQSIASLRSFARVYVDEDVQPGVAYEYRISRPSKEKIETGYWTTGRYQKWTPVIGQRMDEYKCFLHHEPSAQRGNNEKTKTKPFI